ncbi:MAG: ArsC/Spx/MgsR family protein [candidate division Zixibacteria bacterium]
MLKRAQMYCKKSNSSCEEAISFLEENGVIVSVRDMDKNPLTRRELHRILGYQNPKYYLDMTSPIYSKKKLDIKLPPREELLEMIVEHPELLRQPIIQSGRLMTIGVGKKQLAEMFQISTSDNGSGKNKKTHGVRNK